MKSLYSIGKITLVGLLLIIFHSSCTDLDEELFDTVTPENFFQSDEEFLAAVGGAYTSLYGYAGGGPFILQEVPSDAMVVPTRGQDWDDGGHWRRLHTHAYQPDDPEINGAWNFAFGGVNDCNRIIFQLEELNPEGADVFITELEALRAFYYYLLLDLYGNVPIVTEFDVPSDFAPSNSSRAEVFDFVESEILRTLPLLTDVVGGEAYGRMNQMAAQMMLAKLYLNAEVYTGTSRIDDALVAVDAIINSGNYSLAADYYDNFVVDNSSSPEFIFAIPYDQVFATGFNLVARTLHYGSQATFNLTFQPWNGFCSLQEFVEMYADDDLRKQNFILGPQFALDGSPIIDGSASLEDPDGPPLTFTAEINELGPQALRQAGARIGKFEFGIGSQENMSNDFPIFRYSDALLMKAEILLRQGNEGESLALVNQIRQRAGVAPFTSLTLETLLDERGREMFAEAFRRQDLIRFGVYNDAWQFKDPSPTTVNIFPIPRAQIDANPNLTQNPGY